MTSKAGTSVGGIVGFILGLLVVGGLAGTPLYLNLLRTDQDAVDADVRDDVEAVRRIVLNLDEHLGVMSAVYGSLGEEARPESKAMRDLLANNDELLMKAQAIFRKFTEVRHGGEYATDHLAVNRIGAVFYLSIGKINGNRAEFEERFAEAMRGQFNRRINGLVALKRSADLLDAGKPTEALSRIEERTVQLEAIRQVLDTTHSDLKNAIADKEAEVSRLESAGAEARRGLIGLETQGLSSDEYQSAFAELSAVVRTTDAKVSALRHGTLEGGTLVFDETTDLLDAVYEGGVPQMGIRDLSHGMELLQGQLSAVEKTKTELDEQREKLNQSIESLDAEKTKILTQVDTIAEEIDELRARADQHTERAAQSRRKALIAFGSSAEHIMVALKAAKKRTRDAATALSEMGEVVDERLQRIKKDSDTEAALHCLNADVAYNTALTRLNIMNALQAKYDADSFAYEMSGGVAPAAISDQIDAVREQAAEKLAVALDAFKDARNKIKNMTVRGSDGTTISGNNLLWQIDVGEAAVHLLEANLAADRAQRAQAQDKAYELLTSAAQDREQSPLLAPAIDTLLFLQRTAR